MTPETPDLLTMAARWSGSRIAWTGWKARYGAS